MNYSITTLGKKTIAGFHLVGPQGSHGQAGV